MKKYKLFNKVQYNEMLILITLGSIVGYFLENIWIYILFGLKETHSSLVIGPFCLVYGIGFAIVYALTKKIESKNIFILFLSYASTGALIEYLCSVFQELFLGSRSWNYSNHIININGRTSLEMAIIWGILGLIFIYLIYPVLKQILRIIDYKIMEKLCILLTIFMIFDASLTVVAINRWYGRMHGIEPTTNFEKYLDERYTNEKMKQIFCNMHFD